MAFALPSPTTPQPGRHTPEQRRAWLRYQSGRALAERNQWWPAAQAYAEADRIGHDIAYGLAAAHALIKAGRSPEAECAAQRLCRARPQCTAAYTLRAQALLELGRPAEAVAVLRAQPGPVAPDLDRLSTLAIGLQRVGAHAAAVTTFFEALALKLDHAALHYLLAQSFKELGLKAEAAECVRTAVKLGVGASDLAARGQLWFLERESCRWPQAEQAAAELRAQLGARPEGEAAEASPFVMAVLSPDPAEALRMARRHARHVARGMPALPRRLARAHGGRLRLGYLSSDFHGHATSQLMAQLLECHDRTRFEVSLFSAGPDDGSALRRRVQNASEHFVELHGLPHAAMARRIREAGTDILVDLKGVTYDNLLPVLAARPAPLQASWLGYPGSVGADFIDYVIGDPVVTPLADAADFSERIAQLPGCYQPNDLTRPRPRVAHRAATRAEHDLPEDALVLCAFHQSYKIAPAVFDTWCTLLHELPDAVLWLLQWNQNVQTTLTAAAAARGIAPERLRFAPFVPLETHLARLGCADLYLDAWPCNAHTTAGEALWMGLPVVTLAGATFAQRVGASLLRACGLDSLIAQDEDGYRRLVRDLAQDPPRRAALQAQLQTGPAAQALFDGQRRARELEALLERMWQRAVQGQPPDHLPAQALEAA